MELQHVKTRRVDLEERPPQMNSSYTDRLLNAAFIAASKSIFTSIRVYLRERRGSGGNITN